MARRGKFGRGTTGSANLSSFISSLVQQSISMNERALINAFQDQTEYSGSVPTGADIEAYVDSRLQGVDPNSADYAYYVNLRETALRQERAKSVQSLTDSFNSSMGDNFNEFYDEISSILRSGNLSEAERQEFQSVLTSKTADYVELVGGQYKTGAVSYEELLEKTDSAIGLLEGTVQENALVYRADVIMDREAESLSSGMLSGSDYKTRVEAAFRGIDPESATTFDLKNKMFTTIWNAEVDKEYGKVLAAQDKPTGKQINKTQNYLDWARGKLSELEASGITGGELYNSIKNNIASYDNTLSELKVEAGSELYNSRKANAEASRSVLDQFAAQAAVYVSGAAANSLRDMTGGVTLNNLLAADPFAMVRYFDINPSAQEDFNAALDEYRTNTKGLVATAKAIGSGKGKAMALRNDAVEIARYTQQDTTLEDYEDAFDKKIELVGKANGDDSVIESINAEWLSFLKGNTTSSFGKGISPASDNVFAGLIANEQAVYEVGGAGGSIDAIGSTLIDYILPSKAVDGDTRTNSQIESEEAAKTTQMSALLKTGKAVRFVDGNGVGSTVPLRQADQAKGEYTFAELNANGKMTPVIRQGIPVNGTLNGSAVKGTEWGFYYPDTGVWVGADGKTYTSPPIKMLNGGAPEYDSDGNPVRITFAVDPSTKIIDGSLIKGGAVVPRERNKDVVEVDQAIAITNAINNDKTGTYRTAGPKALITKPILDAITHSFDDPTTKKNIEDQVAIYNERVGRFDVGYGESRLTRETPGSLVSPTYEQKIGDFKKFIGEDSTDGQNPMVQTIITKGADGKNRYTRVAYSDAYTETSPGVFVRKDSATTVDALFGKPIPETKQFFPKTIDVSSSLDLPAVKPYVAKKNPSSSAANTAQLIQDQFFRNAPLPNSDSYLSRSGSASSPTTYTPGAPIQPKANLFNSQPMIDFRSSERESISSPIATFGGINIQSPTIMGLGSPTLQGISGDSLLERKSSLTGTTPGLPKVGGTARGGTR